MLALVDFIQVRRVERHAAVSAHVRPVARVNLLVGDQTGFGRQTQRAMGTVEAQIRVMFGLQSMTLD